MLDLLDLARIRSRSLLRVLLETSHAEIEVDLASHGQMDDVTSLEILPLPDHPDPAPIVLFCDGGLIATVRSADHADMAMVLDSGLELALALDGATLQISVLVEVG